MRIVDGTNTVTLTAGAQGALPDGQLGEYDIPQGEMDPSAGRSMIPGQAVLDPTGPTTYTPAGPLSACGAGCNDAGSGPGVLGMLSALVLAQSQGVPQAVPHSAGNSIISNPAYKFTAAAVATALATSKAIEVTTKVLTSVDKLATYNSTYKFIATRLSPEATDIVLPLLAGANIGVHWAAAALGWVGVGALLLQSNDNVMTSSQELAAIQNGTYGQSPGAFGNTEANPTFGDASPTSPVETPQSSSSDFPLTPPFQPADPFFNAIFAGGPTVQPQNQADQPVPQLSCDMCVPLPPPPSWQGTISGPLDTPAGGGEDNQ
jgi:hypothetical protein